MSESRNIHWTDDDELLSKFVLHQLTTSEEDTLSSHLTSCEKCRHAVKEEITIVAGAKLAGRAALKERLVFRLSESEQRVAPSPTRRSPGHQIPWTQIVSVAAVVTIIIVVGVYNNWFISDSWNKAAPQEQLTQKQETPTLSMDRKENEEPPPEKLLEKDLAQSVNSGKLDNIKDGRVKRTEVPKKKASEEKSAARDQSATFAAAEPVRKTGTGVAVDGGRKAENEPRLVDEVASPEPQTYWVEGHVIQGALRESRGGALGTPESPVSNLMKHEAEARNDRQTSKAGTDIGIPTISLRQEPSSSLPATLQLKQQQGAIQTLIENKNDAIQVTLYLDSPVANSELRSANIEVVDTDSLILNLRSQRIGLRLPPAFQGQVISKTRQVR